MYLADGIELTRPIVGVTVVVMIGTALGFFCGNALLWLILATVMCAIVAWRIAHCQQQPCLTIDAIRLNDLSLGVLYLVLTLVAVRAALVSDVAADGLKRLDRHLGQTIQLRVQVANDAQTIARKRGGNYCAFSADEAFYAKSNEPVEGTNLLVNYYGSPDTFPQPGQWLLVEGRLQARTFRFRRIISVREGQLTILPAPAELGLSYRFAQLRARLASHLKVGLSADAALPIQTMVLGTRQKLSREDRDLYADAGIVHVFAISGMHVGILAGLLFMIIRCFPVPHRIRGLLISPFLIFYLLLTGLPPSAVRACVMALIYINAPLFQRKPDPTSALCITAIGVFLITPGWIANIGAMLSFGVMMGILLLYGPIDFILNVWFGSIRSVSELKSIFRTPWHIQLRRMVAGIVAVMIAAWIGSFPLTLFYFGRVSFAGLLLNLVIPFIATTIFSLAMVSCAVGFFADVISASLNQVCAMILSLVNSSAQLLVRNFEFFWVVESPPGLTLTLILEGGVILLAIYLRQWVHTKRIRLTNDPLDPIYLTK